MSQKPRPPALDPATIKPSFGTGYPDEHRAPCEQREKRAVGDALGLSHFGVNLTRLPPGAWSALRHWHANEDDFIYIIEGALTLVTNDGRQVLTPGMVAGFPAGSADGHQLVNEGAGVAVYLEVGDRSKDEIVEYPDVDMRLVRKAGTRRFERRDGTPYPPRRAT